MARLSIEELRRRKMLLLGRDKARKELRNAQLQRRLERKRLKAEIRALSNPGSIVARNIAKKIAIRSAKIIFKGGVALGKHLSAVAAEQNRPVRKRKVKRKSKSRKRK